MRSALHETYIAASLLPAGTDGASPAQEVEGRPGDYVTIGPLGGPVLLLTCTQLGSTKRPPIKLRHLGAEYGVRYRIQTSSALVEESFVVLSLRGDDLTLAEPFCLACDVLIGSLSAAPSAFDVDRVVRQLVHMMSALALPSARTVSGLWAELWLMSISNRREAAVEAWHRDTSDRFDFSFATHFAEVKATEGEDRSHEFSYEQLRRSERPVVIVSLRLRRAQSGQSIADLIDVVQVGLPQTLREKLVRNAFSAVGAAISDTDSIRYDGAFCEATLRVIAAERVPVVEIPPGSPISAVRFRVNLDDSSLAEDMVARPASTVLVSP
jgi:hypothetical protein